MDVVNFTVSNVSIIIEKKPKFNIERFLNYFKKKKK